MTRKNTVIEIRGASVPRPSVIPTRYLAKSLPSLQRADLQFCRGWWSWYGTARVTQWCGFVLGEAVADQRRRRLSALSALERHVKFCSFVFSGALAAKM
jgi:hypothetical protein